MRLWEVLLVLSLDLFAVLLLLHASKQLKQLLLLGISILLGLHVLLEGAHWQMAPAYAAILFSALSIRSEGAERKRKLWAGLVLILSTMSIAFSIVLPIFSLPKPTGPYEVGTKILYLQDDKRHEPSLADPTAKRRLVVQLWYPADPSNKSFSNYRRVREADLFSSYESVIKTNARLDAPIKSTSTPFPLLLLSHGLGGRRTALTYLAEDLASHGYVVASIDYPYIAARVEWSDGNVIRGTRKFIVEDPESSDAATAEGEWNKELELWGADQEFVLNTLQQENHDPKSVWHQKINTDLVGAIGHSFGGSAALYVSGLDPRIKSAINIDGWTFGGISNRTSDKPVMFIYGDLDSLRLDDPSLTRPPLNVTEQLAQKDYSAINRTLRQYGGYAINLTETNHVDFTDKALITSVPRLRQREQLGPIKPAEIHSIVRAYVRAFFDKTLLQEQSPLLDPKIKSPYPEVTFQRWTPEAPTADAPPR